MLAILIIAIFDWKIENADWMAIVRETRPSRVKNLIKRAVRHDRYLRKPSNSPSANKLKHLLHWSLIYTNDYGKKLVAAVLHNSNSWRFYHIHQCRYVTAMLQTWITTFQTNNALIDRLFASLDAGICIGVPLTEKPTCVDLKYTPCSELTPADTQYRWTVLSDVTGRQNTIYSAAWSGELCLFPSGFVSGINSDVQACPCKTPRTWVNAQNVPLAAGANSLVDFNSGSCVYYDSTMQKLQTYACQADRSATRFAFPLADPSKRFQDFHHVESVTEVI